MKGLRLARRVGLTFLAAYFAVTVAYAVVIPFGWWERNVLALGVNWLPATVLSLITLLAQRSRQPVIVQAVLGSTVTLVMVVVMLNTIPSRYWAGWTPMYAYLLVAFAIPLPLSRALMGREDGEEEGALPVGAP